MYRRFIPCHPARTGSRGRHTTGHGTGKNTTVYVGSHENSPILRAYAQACTLITMADDGEVYAAASWTKNHVRELLGRLGGNRNAVHLMELISRLHLAIQSCWAAFYHAPNYVASVQLVAFERHADSNQCRQAVRIWRSGLRHTRSGLSEQQQRSTQQPSPPECDRAQPGIAMPTPPMQGACRTSSPLWSFPFHRFRGNAYNTHSPANFFRIRRMEAVRRVIV